jgi:putative ABC transport system permease protein
MKTAPKDPIPTPPAWMDYVLEKFLPPQMLEDVQGDLHEVFARQAKERGQAQAKRAYLLAVLPYVKFYFLKRKTKSYPKPFFPAMLFNYFQIGLRNFQKRPGYSLLNCLGLSLGMAGGIILFLFIYLHYQTDLYHPQANQMYRIVLDLHLADGRVEHSSEVSFPMTEAFRRDYPAVEKAAFLKEIVSPAVSLTTSSGENRRFLEEGAVLFTNPDYFQLFSYQWLSGNAAQALKEPLSVVLTRKYALKYFGQTNVVGKVLSIQDVPLQVTGVVADYPPVTDFKKEVFVSISSLKHLDAAFDPTDFTWTSSRHQLFLKLKQKASAEDLQNQLPSFSRKYFGELAKAYQFQLQPLREVHFDLRYGGSISWTLLGVLALIGMFIIGIASINFINLATVQAFLRAKEVGVRQVLGSSRRQVFLQLLVETAMLIFLAGVLSMAFTFLYLPLLNQWMGLTLHAGMLVSKVFALFWLLTIGVVVLLAGGYPAFVLSRLPTINTLKGRYLHSRQVASVRKILVVVQFTIALVLITSTLIVKEQLWFFHRKDLGFKQSAIVSLLLPKTTLTERQALKDQLFSLAGVENVTFQYRPPVSEANVGGSFRFGNRSEWEKFPIRDKWADSQYLKTYGLKLVAGRNFMERDSLTEVVVNETFVRKLGFQDPANVLNQTIEDGTRGTKGVIVGVVKDFNLQSLHQAIEPCAIFYYPEGFAQVGIQIQHTNLPYTLTQIKQQWQKILPHSVFSYQFLDEQIARFYHKEQLIGRIVNWFSVLAILIAGLGLFGLAAFAAQQRTKEIGVRKVLGASVLSIVSLLTKDFLKLVFIAFFIATPIAWYLSEQWLQGFAFRIRITWVIFALAGTLSLLIALITVSFQAIKASLVNPVKSLRSE